MIYKVNKSINCTDLHLDANPNRLRLVIIGNAPNRNRCRYWEAIIPTTITEYIISTNNLSRILIPFDVDEKQMCLEAWTTSCYVRGHLNEYRNVKKNTTVRCDFSYNVWRMCLYRVMHVGSTGSITHAPVANYRRN